jgi:tRNA/tmRNA/rRNA uracil-C5-methylase (TrmA/RlmC/RlmD family)
MLQRPRWQHQARPSRSLPLAGVTNPGYNCLVERDVELVIDDIAFGGKGVGRAEGKAVFVPFTIEGERVTARVVREKKSFAEADLVSVLEASPQRTTPLCPYFGRCGGCSYQHMSYEHQLHWKAGQVRQALQRIGKFREPPVRPIVPSPRDYEYRNRITVHVENGIVGFFRHDAHRLIDIERCAIAQREVNEELATLRARRPRDGHYTLRARGGPRVFSQTNDAVATHLADALAALIPPNDSLLIDAYCGAGFFAKRLLVPVEGDASVAGDAAPGRTETGPAAGRGQRPRLQTRVVGIDWDIHAIAAAQANASETETYLAGEIATHLGEQLRQADPKTTTIIVDPPATGLGADVREILRRHPVATLLYVSCNPPTLARDLADLGAAFTLQSVTPFDMFPQTAEIEILAHLTRRSDR